MDVPEKSFFDVLDLLKSWNPWRPEPTNVSRDFWMPDQSCRVCYECDSQFTLLNRRHHCRHCGRVFCAKCTSNWVPALGSPRTGREEWEKIRVCNFCFKQWEQGLATVDNGIQVASLDLSASPSVASLTSSKSSYTFDSNAITFASMPHSVDSYQQNHPSVLSPHRSAEMERNINGECLRAPGRSNDHAAGMGNPSPDHFGFCMNRSDDDNDEFGVFHLDSEKRHFPQDSYYAQVEDDEMDYIYRMQKVQVHPDEETVDTKSVSSPSLHNSFDSRGSEGTKKPVEKGEEGDIGDECEATCSLYAAADVDAEPVDFENNGLLWLPPEPEDEDDERETLLYDDDDDYVDATGEWGYLRASSSFGSGEYRNRDRSNEEHNKAMKNVVNGHFKALIAQLLQVENFPLGEEDDKDSWLEIITSLSWEAATLLKPDMSKGGGMDPGGYVKVKCLASGRRCESMVIKGIVCKKNVAHRRMPSRIEKPRLMILGGALEYQRVSNHLSSFDTLLQQEMEHLKMAVAKIDAHQPDVLLVEKSVSRFAQEYLLAKNISLVLNIKGPLLERISRCTGAQKVPSVDHLSSKKLGYCDMFHLERFLEEHGTAGQGGKKLVKTLMYFEGCPKPLGCTILLRGANGDELKKVKHVIHYAVFAAYHLALETSFLADEGASLPELPLNSPITVALPDKPSSIDSSTSKVVYKVNGKTQGSEPSTDPQRSNSFPAVDLVSSSFDDVEKKDRAVLPHSPDTPSFQNTEPIPNFVNSTASVPSVAFSGQDTADRCHGKWPSNHVFQENCMVDPAESSAAATSMISSDQDVSGGQLIGNGLEPLEATVQGLPADNAKDISTGVNTNDLPRLAVSCNMPSEEFPEDFPPSPSDHQGILVSLSSRCVWKGTVCENPHLFRIKYYGKLDKPLGRYLRDHLFDQSYRCQSCDMPAEAHVHCYTHRQGTLTISVRMLPEILLPGEREGKIWMWHRCLRCPRTNGFPPATRRIVMSDAAWGLSFGKFLEISFSDHAAASRVASCGHSLHRDCLRFYGYGKMVACFRYASINVHSVYLPPHELDFNYENQEWIQKEMNEVVCGAELLFAEVLNALSRMAEKRSGPEPCSICMKTSESRHQVDELKFMLQKEKAEFEESLQKILKREVKKGQPVIDILEINRLRRQLLFQSYMWDHRLVYAASSAGQGLQDDFSERNLEYMEEPLSANGNFTNMNMPVKPAKGLSGPDLVPMDVEFNVSPDHEGVIGYEASQHKVICQGIEEQIDSSHEKEIQSNHSAGTNKIGSSHGKEIQSNRSAGTNICVEPDEVESNIVVHTSPSDTQFSEIASLSDSYDAAWTGKNHPGFQGPKADSCSAPESAIAESSAETAVIEKLEFGNIGDDQTMSKISSASPVLSTKGSDYLEESISWLRMPFINFYRSFNKNFLCSAQKLDTLGEYNPVYVSSFREMELQGGAGLLLPVGVNDTVVPVYDDEPTSIISYALVSPDYLDQLSDECPKDSGESTIALQSVDSVNFLSFHSFDEMASESYRSLGSMDDTILSMSGSRSSLVSDPVSSTKALHARVSFADERHLGKVKYNVTCYYAKQFEALRRICCPSEMDFVRSISRCKKWGAQGGKSNVFFAKTLDDRFIIKQVTKTELESFIKFAPQYFRYLSHSIGTGSPTCLAKILGMYQITSKHLKGGKESKIDVLVMENLLFGRYVTRLYDLKGSSRSRYNPDSSGSNKVLLDQNLIEAMPTCPIFVGTKAKRSLERAVWNDTSFLASVDVMDYSLLVGVDEEKHQLVIGIIDFMRQYTWDKHLETWVKASGILGGPKNTSPTIISPKQYKRRFRKAMTTYFLMVPDQWCRPSLTPSKSQTELCEENTQGGTLVE